MSKQKCILKVSWCVKLKFFPLTAPSSPCISQILYIYVKKLILTKRKVSEREKGKKIVDLTVGWISKAASVKKINKNIYLTKLNMMKTLLKLSDFSARLWWTAKIKKITSFNLLSELSQFTWQTVRQRNFRQLSSKLC